MTKSLGVLHGREDFFSTIAQKQKESKFIVFQTIWLSKKIVPNHITPNAKLMLRETSLGTHNVKWLLNWC
jgi:hypothetical protein